MRLVHGIADFAKRQRVLRACMERSAIPTNIYANCLISDLVLVRFVFSFTRNHLVQHTKYAWGSRQDAAFKHCGKCQMLLSKMRQPIRSIEDCERSLCWLHWTRQGLARCRSYQQQNLTSLTFNKLLKTSQPSGISVLNSTLKIASIMSSILKEPTATAGGEVR